MSTYTVLSADDHPLYRGALPDVVLEAFDDVACVVCDDLGIREITVKAHVSAILRKLGVDNRLQAVLPAERKQL